MSGNITNYTRATNASNYVYQQPAIITVFYSIEIVFACLGTFLNLWFLVTILTSREMRSRLRTKIICNILVVNLIDSTLIIPAKVLSFLSIKYVGCTFRSAFANMMFMQDFIVNWLVVILLAAFIAQIMDCNARSRLTPRTVTASTVGLMALPWIASLVVVPIIVHDSVSSKPEVRRYSYYCYFMPLRDAYKTFRAIDTIAPVLLVLILVVIAAVLRRRRFSPAYISGSMQAELISRGPDIDKTFAYFAVAGVCIACDFLRYLMLYEQSIFKEPTNTWLRFYFSSVLASDGRVVVMVLPWLLLPDFRERIKTWRPWRRSTYGIDLTVAYTKEEA